MNNKFTYISAGNLLILFLILMVLPFIFLNAFNHPSGDDFGAELTKMTGFFESQIKSYNHWSGKILSNALLCYNPVYFHSIAGYKILSLTIMLIFFYVLYVFISEYTSDRLRFRSRLTLTLAVLFLFFYAVPSVAQSFYWITGSVVYMFSIIFMMLFFILYNRIDKSDNPDSKKGMILTGSLLLIANAWSSEIAMGLMLMIMFLMVAEKLFTERKLSLRLTVFAIATGISSYIVISAPGNHVRQEMYPESGNLIFATSQTLLYLFPLLMKWIFYTPLIPITILMLPVLAEFVKNKDTLQSEFSVNPLYPVVLTLLFIFATTFVPFWSMGKDPYYRNMNFVYFIFLIGWFFSIFSIVLFYGRKHDLEKIRIPKALYLAAVILIALSLYKKNNIRIAYADLLRGTAYNYDKELNDRYDFIENSVSDTVVVAEIKSVPRTLFVCDIFSDPDALLNQLYAHYFNKKAIYIKENLSAPADEQSP